MQILRNIQRNVERNGVVDVDGVVLVAWFESIDMS